MKKIIYLAPIRLPTHKAHGVQIMETCSALADLGVEKGFYLELWVPTRKNPIKEGAFDFYRKKANFLIRKIYAPDFIFLGKFGFIFTTLFFTAHSLIRAWGERKNTVFYTRHYLIALPFSFFTKHVFWETHSGEYGFFIKMLLKRVRGVITITQGLLDFYDERGLKKERGLVAFDGVSEIIINSQITKKEARDILGLNIKKQIVMYIGSLALYSWKGVDVFLDSATIAEEVDFFCVGGKEGEIESLRGKYTEKNIFFVPQVSRDMIIYYLKAADILVLPNKAGDVVSEQFTSPMKLFEYMASGNPIVASRLPSILEVLNESNAYLFEANDAKSLAQGIKNILQNKILADKISLQAKHDVINYTWGMRALKIYGFIISNYKNKK